ncbi:MAG: hypothetical protein LBD02_03035 [Christensenellaceae bacterium]|nr:hypothetical protein [Christensenellaceae bacterium]
MITPKERYLKTLPNGTHWFAAEPGDGGNEETRLVVGVASVDLPRTGDKGNLPGLWLVLAVSALGAARLILWLSRQRGKNFVK